MEDARSLVCARCGRCIELNQAAFFRPRVVHIRCPAAEVHEGDAPASAPPSGENQGRLGHPRADRPPRESAA